MNIEWLLKNADSPIKYNLTQDESYIASMLENSEVKTWLCKLTDRAQYN